MDLPIVLSHKTAWLYHNVVRPSEPLPRSSSLYDEDSIADEAEPAAALPKLGLDAKGAENICGGRDCYRLPGLTWYST